MHVRCHNLIFHYLTYPLTARVVGAPQLISQPVSYIFPVLHCPLGLAELQAGPFPDVVLPPLPLSALLLSPFTVPCKMVLARHNERETWSHHCSLCLFTMVWRSSCGPIACWILARTPRWWHSLCMRCMVSCGSTPFPRLVFFFVALLWGSMIHKHTGRWMWQGSASVVSWSWEKYSCLESRNPSLLTEHATVASKWCTLSGWTTDGQRNQKTEQPNCLNFLTSTDI